MKTTFHTATGPREGLQTLGGATKNAKGRASLPSIVVNSRRREDRRTALSHGLSFTEMKRLSAAAFWLEKQGASVFLSTPGRTDNDPTATRVLSDRLKSHYCRFCALNALPPRWVEVWETRPGPHSHIICGIVSREKARALRKSISRSKVLAEVDVKPVYNRAGLVEYLFGEMSSTARFASGRPMRKGAYKLPGGGDRVRLSRTFEAELLAARLVEPWPKTNARRISKTVNVAALNRDFERARVGLFFADELPLLAMRQKPKAPPRKRERIGPPSLPLDYPPSVADMIAGLGLTHDAIAARVGISRQQVTNVIAQRFGISRPIARRVLELARAA
jgi:hypothetical protein